MHWCIKESCIKSQIPSYFKPYPLMLFEEFFAFAPKMAYETFTKGGPNHSIFHTNADPRLESASAKKMARNIDLDTSSSYLSQLQSLSQFCWDVSKWSIWASLLTSCWNIQGWCHAQILGIVIQSTNSKSSQVSKVCCFASAIQIVCCSILSLVSSLLFNMAITN